MRQSLFYFLEELFPIHPKRVAVDLGTYSRIRFAIDMDSDNEWNPNQFHLVIEYNTIGFFSFYIYNTKPGTVCWHIRYGVLSYPVRVEDLSGPEKRALEDIYELLEEKKVIRAGSGRNTLYIKPYQQPSAE